METPWPRSCVATTCLGCGSARASSEPAFHKFRGERCGALQLHVTERDAFKPYRTGLAVLVAVRRLWPGSFAWRTEPYEFRADVPAIDLLTGRPAVRQAIDGGAPLDEVARIAGGGNERYDSGRERARCSTLERATAFDGLRRRKPWQIRKSQWWWAEARD